jgi:hypothetical protein
VTVDARLTDADAVFSFLPEEWLDFEGNLGCTSDLVISELQAGDSLVQRLGWDTLGYYDRPPTPGGYTVDATFDFTSRTVPPAGQEAIDEFSVVLTLPIVVEGPEIDYVSPGEAFDALLSAVADDFDFWRRNPASFPRGARSLYWAISSRDADVYTYIRRGSEAPRP